MDFSLSPDQATMRREIIAFARETLNDGVIGRDRDGVFPRELWTECARLGLMGLPVPDELGGSGLDPLSTAEAGVARLLLAGASNAEIAGARRRSVGTVAKQVAAVFRKLRVRSRGELYAKAGARAGP